MKALQKKLALPVGVLLLCAGLAISSGCNDAVESQGDTATFIIVDPALITLTEPAVITFTVQGISEDGTVSDEDTFFPPDNLLMPLVWEVSDPSLGAIIASGGLNATYQSTSLSGVQIITVRDQGDAVGQQTVIQDF